MYNRYSPKPDGSFEKNRIPEQPKPPAPPPCPTPPPTITKPVQHNTIPNFLRQLLPGDFDTGDLLVALLLLLMAGDSPEERDNAILTLALYFIM